MNSRFPHIARSIMTPIIVCLLIGVASAILIWSVYFNRLIEEYLFERARENTFLMLNSICHSFMASSLRATPKEGNIHRNVLEDARFASGVKVVNVFDDKGHIVYSNLRENEGKLFSEYPDRFPEGGEELSVLAPNEQESVYHCVLVMKNSASCHQCHLPDKPILGGIQAEVSLKQTILDIVNFKRLVYLLAIALILIILVTCFVVFYFYFQKPVQKLLATMGSVEQGNLCVRMDEKFLYEIKELADGFNHMIESLEQNRKRLHEAHVFELRQLEKNASLGKLAMKLSHEMKNPLACIDSALHSLSHEIELSEVHREIMGEVRAQVTRLDNTIYDFLTLARPKDFDCQFLELREILEKTLLLVEQKARDGNVGIVKNFSPPLSESTFEYNQMQRVFLNIFLNALEAMPGGGTLRVDARDDPGHVFVEIADTGEGIPADAVDKIFQPFFTTKPRGTGLGLAIARQIVESQQGTIRIHSEAGQGTRAVIVLPKEKIYLKEENQI